MCIRIFEFATLMPDWPPSPKMVTDHFLPFVVACVPLSCVPPWMSFALLALEDRLWNWSVERPSFSDVIVFGIFDSQLVQSVRSRACEPAACALRGRVDERAVEPEDAAVVPDEDDVGAERHAGDRVLVRVEADALRVDRHVGEVRRRRPASAGSPGRSTGTGSDRRRRSRRTASRRRCRPRPGTRAASTRACRRSTARRSSCTSRSPACRWSSRTSSSTSVRGACAAGSFASATV